MEYYNIAEISTLFAAEDINTIENFCTPIKVRFCRDCPFFELNYWQPDEPDIQYGWCRRMSYYRTFDNESPYYISVNSKSFCNEDDITREYY